MACALYCDHDNVSLQWSSAPFNIDLIVHVEDDLGVSVHTIGSIYEMTFVKHFEGYSRAKEVD